MEETRNDKDTASQLAGALTAMLAATAQKMRDGKIQQQTDLGVKHGPGTEILLPSDPHKMLVKEAIQVLLDFEAKESQEFTINEFLPGMPHDAAHAFVHVLKARYGWVNPQTKMTIFGPEPPKMVRVYKGVGADNYVEVPVGKFKLQDIPNADLETGFARDPNNKAGSFASFFVRANVKFKERAVIMDLINETRDFLKTGSIYRGKAMRLPVDSDGHVEASIAPVFIDLSKVSEEGLVLTKKNYALLNHTVWTPIRKTALCRQQKIPLKRGALLWGPFGTGKTLTALVTARIAEENGWTFIMLDNAKGLPQALEMAQLYQPAVVFAEDIDRVVVKSRDERANDVLNTIDGALSKNSEVITVLTTNEIDKINEAMLRPGRLDALIHVTVPDAEAAERLVRLYAGSLLAKTVPLTALGKLIEAEQYIPAIIAEIVNRSKLAMIYDERQQLVEEDLLLAAELIRDHSARLAQKQPEPSKAEKVGLALFDLLGDQTNHYSGSDLQNDVHNDISISRDGRDWAETAADRSGELLALVKKLAEKGTFGTNGSGDKLNEVDRKLSKIAERLQVS